MSTDTPISHWIGGKPATGLGARRGEVYDPATGEVSGTVVFAAPEDVDAAVAAASAAFPDWRDSSLTKRAQVLFAFRELLNAAQGRARRDHHRPARQGALRRRW